MLSPLHEVMVNAFRHALDLAPDLLRNMSHAELPKYDEIRIESSDFAQTTVVPRPSHAGARFALPMGFC